MSTPRNLDEKLGYEKISEPPDAIKIAIARYFNISVDYLIGLTNNPAPVEQGARVLRLPNGFPMDMLPELKRYAEFLTAKKHKD